MYSAFLYAHLYTAHAISSPTMQLNPNNMYNQLAACTVSQEKLMEAYTLLS